jgi:hypothetical protein
MIAAVCALMLLGGAQAADNPKAAAAQAKAGYRCDLRATENLCRQYHVVADVENRVKTLRENCTVLGGSFRTDTACPAQVRVARCLDVVPDPNVLDLLGHTYDAHYYGIPQGRWSRASVREVCINLMGVYAPD